MTNIKFLSDDNEVIRIDAKGFHYRGQFIEDAGEAHRLLVEFLREHQPEGNWQHAQAEPQPVPVSERLPGPEDCDAEGRCWWLKQRENPDYDLLMPTWHFQRQGPAGTRFFRYTHWLPAHALPVPSHD
jgi:hypothetical protein